MPELTCRWNCRGMRCGFQGKILKEAKVASELDALVEFFETLGFAVNRIGLEAGPLSQWLMRGCKERIRDGSAGNTACEGSIVGDDSEDGSQGCTRNCPVDPDGMVPRGARKVDRGSRDPSVAGCAQAASGRLIDVELSIRGFCVALG